MTVTSCPDSRSACERWNPTSPAPATTKYTLASLHGFVDHVGFVRERFWPGRRFVDLMDLNVQALRWRDDFANNRVHEVTA